jgi:hypothetical protein
MVTRMQAQLQLLDSDAARLTHELAELAHVSATELKRSEESSSLRKRAAELSFNEKYVGECDVLIRDKSQEASCH